MPKLFFTNTITGKRYEVIRMDKATKEVVLRGDLAEFTEPYDKARFEKLGYVLEREEVTNLHEE